MKFYLIGFMGAGKSTIGKYAARHNDLPFLDLDKEIESVAGMTIPEIFKEKGENYFRELESRVLREVTESHPRMVLSCGGGTPCFGDNMAFMNREGLTIYLDMSSGRLTDRLRNSKGNRPLLQSVQGDLQIWIHQKLMERASYYAQAKFIVPEEQCTKKGIRGLISKILNANG